jgi:hypothetical protein
LTGGIGRGFLKISLYSGLSHLLSPATAKDSSEENNITRVRIREAIMNAAPQKEKRENYKVA